MIGKLSLSLLLLSCAGQPSSFTLPSSLPATRYQLLIYSDAGSLEEISGLSHALTALGWELRFLKADSKADWGDVLFLPSGSPDNASLRSALERFKNQGGHLAATQESQRLLGVEHSLKAGEIKLEEGLHLAAGPGEMGRLAHALDCWVRDTQPQNEDATGGSPP